MPVDAGEHAAAHGQPAVFGSLDAACGAVRRPVPSGMPSTADAPQRAVAPPQFAHWPSPRLPTESAPKAFAPICPRVPRRRASLTNPPVSSDSSAGISAFVAQIRQTHVPGRESWLERSRQQRSAAACRCGTSANRQRRGRSMCRRFARISRSCGRRCTASRWPGSTTPPRRKSRKA